MSVHSAFTPRAPSSDHDLCCMDLSFLAFQWSRALAKDGSDHPDDVTTALEVLMSAALASYHSNDSPAALQIVDRVIELCRIGKFTRRLATFELSAQELRATIVVQEGPGSPAHVDAVIRALELMQSLDCQAGPQFAVMVVRWATTNIGMVRAACDNLTRLIPHIVAHEHVAALCR
eukprot:CAMPEP_0175882028 /NCGR_PEP_ID=MMETSP0107_2-20121207/43186_1 /TAXON_ID=195067 ORGANISM="Goniomonas pacifica, Strain CCMP1869" /NCGR_SAMPLE_ID=MMETSP0107_2 /ASSEMBLY_ACC=CAM_ASM_000203 /LENGTH=175 /DNA_ID=CAMNT_0017201919 /DNA_START=79 /DNA_END=602 /DNA_ORIENTATION=-